MTEKEWNKFIALGPCEEAIEWARDRKRMKSDDILKLLQRRPPDVSWLGWVSYKLCYFNERLNDYGCCCKLCQSDWTATMRMHWRADIIKALRS